MKTLILIMALMVATTCYAELTPQEETDIRLLISKIPQLQRLYQNATALETLANNTGSETIPLEIAKLKQQRIDKIAERDALKDAEQATCNTAKDTIQVTYETQIDAIETLIQAKQTALENLI